MIRPQVHRLGGELRSVVTEERFRHRSLRRDPAQHTHHIFSLQALPDFDGQTFSREHIHHGQGSKPSPVRQLIGNKVQTPNFIRRCRVGALPPISWLRIAAVAASSAGSSPLRNTADKPASCLLSSPHASAAPGSCDIRTGREPGRSPESATGVRCAAPARSGIEESTQRSPPCGRPVADSLDTRRTDTARLGGGARASEFF